MSKCYECQRADGKKPRDNGAHTAQRRKCAGCGKVRSILPERHWVPEYPNGMVTQ